MLVCKIIANLGETMKKNNNIFSGFFLAESIVFSITMPIIICLFAGVFLDKKFNTKGLLTIIFTVIGSITTLYNIYKLASVKNDKK
jgi:F0F1-type ATP synthase assembly protein I